MQETYFMELRGLVSEENAAPELRETMRACVKGWIPDSAPRTRFFTWQTQYGQPLDYVAFTDQAVYAAILLPDSTVNGGYMLRSVKRFRADAMVAHAAILGQSGEHPQIRLMMSDGMKIRLLLVEHTDVELMQELTASPFFMA